MSNIREEHLPNGMTLLFSPMNHLHGVTFGLYVHGGLVYENRKNVGISQLLSQIFYRRLGDMDELAISRALNKMGARLTNSTYNDAVAFASTTLPRFFDTMTDVFLQFFSPQQWSEKDLQGAKEIVFRQQEEDSVSLEEQVICLLQGMDEEMCSSLGSSANVAKLTLEDVKEWHRLLFAPSNACLCISGNFSPAMEEAVIEAFSEIPGEMRQKEGDPDISIGKDVEQENEGLQPQIPPYFCNQSEESDIIFDSPWESAQVMLTFDTQDEQIFPLLTDVVSACTAGNDDSLLFQKLRQEEALVADISSYVEETCGFRRLIIRWNVRQEMLVRSLEEVFALLHRLSLYVRPARLDTMRMQFTDNLQLMGDDTFTFTQFMGRAFISGDISRTDLASQAQMYSDLSGEDLLTGAQTIFRPENLTIAVSCDLSHEGRDSQMQELMKKLRTVI